MLTQKLAAQLLDAEVTGAPEIENERFLVGKHLLLRQMARAAALVLQSSDAIRLTSAPHFRSVGREMPQRRQTFPASPSFSYSHTQLRRVLTSIPPPRPDETLIRALARVWKRMLERGSTDRLGNWPRQRVSPAASSTACSG